MANRRDSKSRGAAVAIALAVVTVVAVAAGVVYDNHRIAVAQNASTAGYTPPIASEPLDAKPLAPVPAGGRVVVLGDSYTEGIGVEPKTNSWSYMVAADRGWALDNKGVGGTGYVEPGRNSEGTFGSRIASIAAEPAPALIVVQGSTNDLKQDLNLLPEAVTDVMTQLRAKFPGAQIVMLGPVPLATDQLNRTLTTAARDNQVPYINAVNERWINWDEREALIPTEAGHPNAEGYRRIADRFEAALDRITTQP